MTVLVTGGAGYIGSHTIQALRRAGRTVVAIDTLEFGVREAVGDTPLVVGDIADEALVEKVCGDYGVASIIHFAAYKNVGESMRTPGAYWRNNVVSTASLIEAAARCGVDKVVFSSSCSVYGTPAIVPVTEDAPINPESVYAETKATCERMLYHYGTTHGVRSVSLRYFNAAGAAMDGSIGEDWSRSMNLIPLVMKAILGYGGPVQVFGTDYPTADGSCVRDYIHIDDLADAHVRSLDHLDRGGSTLALNVGTGKGSSVLDVIAGAAAVSGRDVPHEIVGRRAGDPITVYADPTKVNATLGWTPRYGLSEILDSAWRWHSTHPDGLATVA